MKLQIAAHRLRSVQGALFVYDNLEQPASLETLRPAPAPGSAILLTSRVDQPDFARVEMHLLERLQALALLASEAGRRPQGPDEEEAADEICAHMDGLPLALELAGGYLRRRPGRSFREYADLLARRGLATTVEGEPRFAARSATRHESSLSDALRIAGPLLDEHADLDTLLDLLAWSGTASMGWPLLLELVRPADPDLLRDGADLAEALRVLRREDHASAPTVPRFRMHRLVQEVRRAEHPADARPAAVAAMVHRGVAWFQSRRLDFQDLDAYEAELDHLDAWVALADRLGLGEARVRLRWLRAYPAWHRGRYRESLQEIEAALAVYRELGLQDPVLEAHLRSDRGVVLDLLGRYREALGEDQEALRLRIDALGEEHADTATSYDNVGGSLGRLGRHAEALKHKHQALALRRQLLGEQHPDTARSYDNVGGTLGDLGRRWEALEHQKHALALRRELQGERHPDMATSHNNVGWTLGALERHWEALEHHQHALALRRELQGERHPDTARSFANLGSVLGQLGRHEEALEHKLRAHSLCRELLGERHPDTALSYASVGHALGELGHHAEALKHQQRALSLCRELLGERHPETTATCLNVLATLHKLGRTREAFDLARSTLNHLGPSSPSYRDIVRAYNATLQPGFRALPESGPARPPARKKKR